MRGKNIERTIIFRGIQSDPTQSSLRINVDDTIAQIKGKIIEELKMDGLMPNQLYLCAEAEHKINPANININPVGGALAIHQLMVNLHIPYDKESGSELHDVLLAGLKDRPIPVGLGMTLVPLDYVFPVNPMYIVPGINISKYAESIHHSNNSILMSYGNIVDNTIFVYFAEDVLRYASEIGIPESDILQIYFPDIPATLSKAPMVDFLYDLYYQSPKLAVKYQERGIHQYDFTLFSENRALFSLDTIFKNIHCSAEIPFIRYKPGIRRDPIYRLYSTSATKSGKRIPTLSYRKITNLINGSANYKHISVYNDVRNVFIHIENDGTIRILGKIVKTIEDNREKDKKVVPTSMSIREINYFLDLAVNPFLTTLNNYLAKSGYKVPLFTSVRSPFIKINNMSYLTAFTMNAPLRLNNGCAFSVFDIADTTKENMVLRFKRVDNFKRMDAQSALISEVYKKTGSEASVIEALMNNYGMSNKEAILRLLEYQENLNYMKGKHTNRAVERTNMFDSIKNPGFLTTIEERKKGEEKREIKIVVSNLNNIKYIETIGIYIDSLARLSITEDPGLLEKCNAVMAIEEPDMDASASAAADANAEASAANANAEASAANANAEAIKEMVAKAQPVDINKLISRFEENDAIREVDSDNDDEIDLEDFLESDSEEGEGEGEGERNEDKASESDADFLESDDDDEELVGGDPDDDDLEGIEDTELELELESEYNTTSKTKKAFIRKLKEHDPKLFSFTQTKSGQFKHYTRVCQSMLQPVVLTQEEKDKIDQDYRGSYTEAVEYGSSPENKNWYICPRFWCFKTNTSMTKEDIDAGKCGKTKAEIKKNVFEFNAPKEHMKSGKYIKHFPGFKPDIHPDGHCLPCCFSEWDTELHRNRRAECMGQAPVKSVAAPTEKRPEQFYIIGPDKMVVDPGRWGFAQYAVQHFLQIDYRNQISKSNTSMIRDKTPTILRYGIRQEEITQSDGKVFELRNRSIVAAFADIYARVHNIRTPSVPDFLRIVADAVTIDHFIQYGNGTYMSIFDESALETDEFVEADTDDVKTEVYKLLDMTNKDHSRFFLKLRRAYRQFLAFLTDPESVIDHTYFWDIIATPNSRLFTNGLNLILMEIVNNDVTENIDIICPTSSYSANQFRVDRESVLMIKMNDLYLPLYKYVVSGKDTPMVGPLFSEKDLPAIYKVMSTTFENYCRPRASITQKYTAPDNKTVFKQPMPLLRLLNEITTLPDYRIEKQVWNYQGKIVSILLHSEVTGVSFIVPCQPSAPVPNVVPATFMDDISILNDYEMTKRELNTLTTLNPNILCRPIVKIFEAGLVVGVITETNQVVRIREPEANVEDGLISLGEENYIFYRDMAKFVETAKEGDPDRVRVVRNVELEADFYSLFRTTLKSVLESAPLSLQQITRAIGSGSSLDEIAELVRNIMAPAVVFGENYMPDEILDDIYKSGKLCQTVGEKKHIGLLTEDKQCIFPRYNLVNTERDNSREYYVRVADELMRFGELRNFILKPQSVLNISNEPYRVNADEYIVVETDLTDKDYFTDMVPFTKNKYTRGIPYDMANPDPKIAQKYSNEVSLEEQIAAGSELLEVINKCKNNNLPKNPKDVEGHPVTNYWRRWVFSRDKKRAPKEIYFKGTAACSFGALIYILQDHFGEIYREEDVRNMIWNGYLELLEAGLIEKIFSVFELQGKRNIVETIKRNGGGAPGFKEMVVGSPEYFLTIMDIWVVAHKYNVPIVAFSSLKELTGMGISVLADPMKSADELPNSWIVMGGTSEHRRFYFVRSPSVVYNYKADIVPELRVLFGPLGIPELGVLEPKLQSALLRLEYVERIQGPEYFLKRLDVRRK